MYTVGHSNRSLEEFMRILKRYGVGLLVDIRRWPSSRRNPQFNEDSLREALSREGIGYIWMGEALGGYRRGGLHPSPNEGWRSRGYRNYADHALSESFRAALRELINLSRMGRVALMCAERRYWRCHRRILSDHLTAAGVEVLHISDERDVRRHRLTRFAVIKDGVVTYPFSPKEN
ncbi:MAG: DUF488 domain-containing protein [Candidatus Bathyarchaeia archaeon]|nr:DUF488 domain-containing protein [Candidatus Bathyarchaeota archaeon]